MENINLSNINSGNRELYLKSSDIEEIAKNIIKVGALTRFQREEIIRRGIREIPGRILIEIDGLILDLAYDCLIYQIANLNYCEGPPINENLFTTAVIDYVLKNKEKVCVLV